MTGQDFYKYFQQKIGYSYTGNLASSGQATNLFKDALYKAIEGIYKSLNSQSEYDRLLSLIKTNVVYAPVSNEVTIIGASPIITDYLHLLSIKAKYMEDISLVVETLTNTTPINVEAWYSSLRNGQYVNVSSATGNTAANGNWYLRQVTPRKYQLYSDALFVTPSVGNGSYVDGVVMKNIYYNQCKQMVSDQKGYVLEDATAYYPKYEMAQGKIKFYPITIPCSEVTIDYITKAAVLINKDDNVIDLELTYPYQFLVENVMSEAVILFAERYRDDNLRGTALQDTQRNV